MFCPGARERGVAAGGLPCPQGLEAVFRYTAGIGV